MRRRALSLALVAALAAAAGCGGGSGPPALKVSAAASLKAALTRYAGEGGARAAFSFAGSDELAAQIRAGGRPDVFAAANSRLPEELFAAGRLERPVPFATNRLVLAVPAASEIATVAGAGRPGVAVAVGAPRVPVGAYTREVLARLGPATARAILANVRSEEPDAGSIVAKLTQGGAEAGFVYVTDVRASAGRLRAVAIPARFQPTVVYSAAVVRGSAHPAQARAFVDGLLEGAGAAALRAAGFGPPPR